MIMYQYLQLFLNNTFHIFNAGFQNQLGEGLAIEAEKILCNLVCWSTDKMIRMKFIEGCLKNIANNRYGIFI